MKQRFFCLFNSACEESHNVKDRLILLKAASHKHGIEFVPLDQAQTDFSSLPQLTANDALYNCARGSHLLEFTLLNRQVKTFYRQFNPISIKDDNGLLQTILEREGISTPKTILCGTKDRKLLNQYVEELGGFPLVVKTFGNSGGLGVMMAESLSALYSLADYLDSKNVLFQMKEWIPSKSVERATVLGNRVLYTISRKLESNDFRSDYFRNEKQLVELDDTSKKLAIQAAHVCNYNFAGVDLIRSEKDGKPYVLEVNFPQNFAPHQLDFNVNCAEEMLLWLFFQP